LSLHNFESFGFFVAIIELGKKGEESGGGFMRFTWRYFVLLFSVEGDEPKMTDWVLWSTLEREGG